MTPEQPAADAEPDALFKQCWTADFRHHRPAVSVANWIAGDSALQQPVAIKQPDVRSQQQCWAVATAVEHE